MDKWLPAEDFIEADVIRWTEGIFDSRRKGKAQRIGERLVAAEVLHKGDDGWVKLLVRSCTITKDEIAGKSAQTLKAGVQIRRGIKTILRGKPTRLLWDDESARVAVLASKPVKSRFAPRMDET
ncbi:hypothetical protein [Parerythrobacter lacustris]|uniref:Uncharacterized protein n=1 Tax=Parerythrobacter lacustris TaxID=2969984 RepID=A0ABT1XL54_9SPHN|nr:hypothetical protein [Parerythrobacter lacustris]MCR2832393.1 hypothetical protein [Parerythrobacter lacustris]